MTSLPALFYPMLCWAGCNNTLTNQFDFSCKKTNFLYNIFRGLVIPSSLREVLINSEANASSDELITSRWSEVKGHYDLLNTDPIVWIFWADGTERPHRTRVTSFDRHDV